MSKPVAPHMETYQVSTQKSAEGIVVVIDEGPNVENEDDTIMSSHAAMSPNGGAE